MALRPFSPAQRLPCELWDAISKALGPADCLALLRTCHEMHQKLHDSQFRKIDSLIRDVLMSPAGAPAAVLQRQH